MWLLLCTLGGSRANAITADGELPPGLDEVKGMMFIAASPEEAQARAKTYLAHGEPTNRRSRRVAEHGNPRELVTLQELAVSNAYEIAVSERKRIRTQESAANAK